MRRLVAFTSQQKHLDYCICGERGEIPQFSQTPSSCKIVKHRIRGLVISTMRLLNFTVCVLLQVFLGSSASNIPFRHAASGCFFPDKIFPGGTIIYESPSDVNETFAANLYILQFHCLPKFYLVGSKFIQCEDGDWTDEVPICASKEKSTAEEEEATTTEEETTSEDETTTSEDETTTTEEEKTTTEEVEESDAMKLSKDPKTVENERKGDVMELSKDPKTVANETKEKLSCADPGVPRFGTRKGKCCFTGTSLHYSCNEEYDLVGEEIIHCLPSGNWSSVLPLCKRKLPCADPGVSKFGTRKGECCLTGTSLYYSCNEEYELVGEEIIRCLPSGNWSSLRPLCKPPEEHCELPPRIPHGIVIGEKEGDYFVPDEEAQVFCEPGYKCKGPEFVVCEEGGEWESEFGECTEILCDPPPPLTNGAILELQSTNLTSFPHNFEITYVCDKKYRLMGDSWRICGKRGWSGKNPICEVTQCSDPGIPEDGRLTGDIKYTVGSSVQFSCYPGYELLGSFQRYCMPNGQWTGELALCDLPSNYCPNPGIPIKGYKNSTNYNLGSKIGFQCQSGHIQLGSEVRECLIDHTWSGTETKCLGLYDFDNDATIRDSLLQKISQIAEEQRMELHKYRELRRHEMEHGRHGCRVLHLNYPGRIILYFAFDVSGSVGAHNFARSIEFAKSIVKKVGISENGARAGALTFGSKSQMEFLPVFSTTTEDVLDALDNITFTGGEKGYSSALTLIRTECIPLVNEYLGKLNVKSVIFLLTDGKANMGGNPTEEAEILKKAGVEIYCIGITGHMRKKDLYGIASKSINEIGEEYPNVYILQNYATLSWLAQEITNGTTDYSQCGLGLENVGNKNSRGRIVGGQQSKKPWPWMAALFMQSRKKDSAKYELKCGGSIIHKHFILTAAHCIFHDVHRNPEIRDIKSIIIKLGLMDTKNESYFQESEVLKMFVHPKYRPGDYFDYDIALLQMEKPAEYNPFVRPICLPPVELPYGSLFYLPNSPAWATGWSNSTRLFKNPDDTQMLKEIYLPLQSKEKCLESTTSNGVNASFFTDRMFCAGDGKGNSDSCQGDSGGALVQSLLNSEGYVYWTQVGIISCGIGCGLPNTYGYYTYVQKFVPWIDETIEKNYYSQCGLGLENVGSNRGRIEGQQSKEPWPWMAALFMQSEKNDTTKYELKCGGSIIHRHFILTAAHCMFHDLRTNPVIRDKKSIIIKLGLTDIENHTYVQEYAVLKMFLHPKYLPGGFFDYDIALLQMEKPAEYNPFVRPICLPPAELPKDSHLYEPNSPAWSTGWGLTGRVPRDEIDKITTTRNLKEIYLPLQSSEICLESLRNASFFTDRMFCAGDGQGSNDTCQCDSGGPLMQSLFSSAGYFYWTQVGIVSWGIGCGEPNTYGYYTYLQKFVPWIDDTIENAMREMNE